MGLTKASYALINGAYFNVLDFGAKGDNITNDQPAIQNAINAALAAGGGTVFIPAGTYKVNSTLTIDPAEAPNSDLAVYIEGSGVDNTRLDFTSATVNTDSIAVIGWSQRFGMSGFTVQNSKKVGININAGATRGSESWVSSFYLRDIVVNNSVSDGFKFLQTYLGEFDNLTANNNEGNGFNLQGFHTSMSFRNCYANQYDIPLVGGTPAGWFINGCVYSSFTSCASDSNAGPGYWISNCAGVVFEACGAESNNQEGFSIRTSNADISSIPAIANGIKGLTFKGCLGVDNGKDDPTLYSNMFNCLTANGIQAYFTIEDCVDSMTHASTYSLVLNAVSGAITCNTSNTFFSADSYKNGQVSYFDRTLAGNVATGIISTNFSVPNATETRLPITSFYTNEIGLTLVDGKVVIPEGINRIRITAGVAWDTNSTGERWIGIYYNNAGFYGHGSQETMGQGYIAQTTTTAIVDVTPTGYFELRVEQNSGGALNVLAGFDTFIQIEVVG